MSAEPTNKDDDGLAGKVAIVTGAGAAGDGIGNGRAAAILLARSRVSVLVVDRKIELAQRTFEMIVAEGGESEAFEADVTQNDQCEAMVKTVLKRYGKLDLLDNNVGIGSRGSVLDEELGACDAHQRREHVPRQQARDPGDARIRRRRRYC
jgi:NAD(P)-dependent dehydrogenase (short-subunit alcohol dehydrogenase family)